MIGSSMQTIPALESGDAEEEDYEEESVQKLDEKVRKDIEEEPENDIPF